MAPCSDKNVKTVPAAIQRTDTKQADDPLSRDKMSSSGQVHGDHLLADEYSTATNIARMIIITSSFLAFLYRGAIQVHIDNLWSCLREDTIFQSAHYETIYVTIVYTILMIFYPFAMHHISFFRRFKISNDVKYVNQTVLGMVIDLVFHITPLIVADMLIIKRYSGVPYSEIHSRKQDWIVRTRPLPRDSPEFITLCLHVAGSVFLFDAFFTIIHYAMHRNRFLYKHFHSQHHDHEVVHAHVTNQLSVVERGLQVISANYALKAFGCHPLTRLVFVPVFLWLLIENHTGIDLPWAPHRLLPGSIMGGPVKHFIHHSQGYGNYQPFFCYIDGWLDKRSAKGKNL